MYFGFGAPRVFCLPECNETVCDVQYNECAALFAVLTASTVSVWSGCQVRTVDVEALLLFLGRVLSFAGLLSVRAFQCEIITHVIDILPTTHLLDSF